jgi:hypothetical protein
MQTGKKSWHDNRHSKNIELTDGRISRAGNSSYTNKIQDQLRSEVNIKQIKNNFLLRSQQNVQLIYRGHHSPPSFDWKLKFVLSSLIIQKIRNEIREVARGPIPIGSYL